jgi:hypothetical protein
LGRGRKTTEKGVLKIDNPMMTPMTTPLTARVVSENLKTLIDELLINTHDEDEEEEESFIPEEFHEFLVSGDQGPKIGDNTVGILARSGVSDEKTFLT